MLAEDDVQLQAQTFAIQLSNMLGASSHTSLSQIHPYTGSLGLASLLDSKFQTPSR